MKPSLIFSALAFFCLLSFCPILPVRSESVEVFLITHSHDDVGWIWPWEQYYSSQVRFILDSVMNALDGHPDRKFNQVEVAFFRRWWGEINSDMKAKAKRIIANGQIEFNVGGITMNDESTTTFNEEINQMTDGADWLFQNLGVKPRANWHIDPFGHSKATASLWAQMGFDSWTLNRIPYYIKDRMKANKGLEFVWRGSSSLGVQSEIFAHVLDSFYFTPSELQLPSNGQFDVAKQADAAVKMIKTKSEWFKHKKLLIPFGNDFDHTDAVGDYNNMDKLINYINSKESQYGVKIHYSFLSEYVKAVHSLNITWDVFEGDFFPYNDGPESFWSGYYTSRPWFKLYLRQCDSFLALAETLLVQSSLNSTQFVDADSMINQLRMATSRATHHDAVSGTETAQTNRDYISSLNDGMKATSQVVQKIVQKLSGSSSPSSTTRYSVSNPLGWRRQQVVSILSHSRNAIVTDSAGKIVQSQVNPVPNYSKVGALFRLYFYVDIPPLSTGLYTIKWVNSSLSGSTKVSTATPVSVSNGVVTLSFDQSTGKLASIQNNQEGKKISASFDFVQYNSAIDTMGQSSGAYIFRPVTDTLYKLGASDSQQAVEYIDLYGAYSDPFAFAISYAAGLYKDSTSVTINKLIPSKLRAAVSRVDSVAGWAAGVQVDFNVFDDFPLKNQLPTVNYALGKFSVGSKQSVRVQFSSASKSRNGGKFNKPPVVILTVQTLTTQYISASLAFVDINGFNANLVNINPGAWTDSDQVILNWFAVDSGNFQTEGEVYLRAGVANIDSNPQGNPYATLISHAEASPKGLSFATVNGGSNNQGSTFVSNLNFRNATCFGAVVRKVGTDQKWSAATLHYIVLPRLAVTERISETVSNIFIDGPLVKEVQQTYAENYVQTFVLYNAPGIAATYAEVISEVGPLNDQGKELVTRLTTNMNTEGVIYTDDNGLEIMKRKFSRVSEELQAGNYFPIVQRSYVQDTNTATQLTLLSDGTHGVASLNPGQMEVMLHRRCMRDDGRGVAEPLDDTTPIRPSLLLSIAGNDQGAVASRYLSTLQQFPPQIVPFSFSGGNNFASKITSLPSNVNLLTYRSFRGAILLRLQHIYAKGEHSSLSKPVNVDIGKLFTSKISSIVEMNLNANTPYSEMSKNRLIFKTKVAPNPQTPIPLNGNILTIQPMEIRTFIVKTN